MKKYITVKGARENNLNNIDVQIPRNEITVITGLSGSGKSSLAYDTVFAEGQRRYMESLNSYARMFIGQMKKPDVDYIDGLSPAISIAQKTTSKNPRSTVGTITEIYDYLRLLWSAVGVRHCPECGRTVKKQTVDEVVNTIYSYPQGTRLLILSPVIRNKKGEHKKTLDELKKSGYTRVIIDKEQYSLQDTPALDKNVKHNIEVVVDRIAVNTNIRRRLTDSIETASSLSNGVFSVFAPDTGFSELFSLNYSCPVCGISFDNISSGDFSFNSPNGACPECMGLGYRMEIDSNLVIPDYSLSINQGAIHASGWKGDKDDSISKMYYAAISEKYGFSLNSALSDIPQEAVKTILYGTDGENLDLKYEKSNGYGYMKRPFEGVVNNLKRRYKESQSQSIKDEIEEVMSQTICPECSGQRLNRTILAVTVGGLNISQFCNLSVSDALNFLGNLKFSAKDAAVSDLLMKELKARLSFLNNVGLGYLTLSRPAATLSGGEGQRIRLATQIGSGLTGVIYILDEPSIGLHQRDNQKLIDTLKNLKDQGNTLLIVEHDEDTIRNSDYVVDIGPGAGVNGGNVIYSGDFKDFLSCENSLTADYLSGRKEISVPGRRRDGNGNYLIIKGAKENNLKNIDVKFPLGCFVCVTGVSGSGKSSLVIEILYKKLAAMKNRAKLIPGAFDSITGADSIDKVIHIDQSPIGKTPRSNPATYTGVFNDIRELFSMCPDSKIRGYSAGRFSFNTKGGRCEACQGDGVVKIEMQFLPDVYVPCDVCGGNRYNRETLEVRYKGKNIHDVLEMTVAEAVVFFDNQPKIRSKLQTLFDVGLGYLSLGQSALSLSGGESQRVKLATELSKRSTGSTLYILDEPTTGLHFDDIKKLILILQKLADSGNSVIVIEHNMDVIKSADYIIDMGPDGGEGGGRLVFSGTPEECAECSDSITGHFLMKYL